MLKSTDGKISFLGQRTMKCLLIIQKIGHLGGGVGKGPIIVGCVIKQHQEVEMPETRAWRAGEALGKAIIETVHLMYQNKTALAFIRALCIELNTERAKREESKPKIPCD